MALTAKKLASEIKVEMFDFDPNATAATAVSWVDMKDFSKLMVGFFRTVGTSAITLTIQASAASNGASAETVVTKTVSSQPDAVGDYIFAECMAEQIAQKGSDTGKALRYVSAVISFATGTDEAVVTYIRSGAKFAYDALTADYVS
jgi:hypothetical protein